MIELAAIRPDDWNLPLFLHVLGALMTIGALVTAASFLFAARRGDSVALTRFGFRSLLIGALPAFLVMRVAAQWISSSWSGRPSLRGSPSAVLAAPGGSGSPPGWWRS